jgi:hypothetical protein
MWRRCCRASRACTRSRTLRSRSYSAISKTKAGSSGPQDAGAGRPGGRGSAISQTGGSADRISDENGKPGHAKPRAKIVGETWPTWLAAGLHKWRKVWGGSALNRKRQSLPNLPNSKMSQHFGDGGLRCISVLKCPVGRTK